MTIEEFNQITNDYIPLSSMNNQFGINKYAEVINFHTQFCRQPLLTAPFITLSFDESPSHS